MKLNKLYSDRRISIPTKSFSIPLLSQDNYEIYELIPVLLLGVIGGLLGSSFIVLNAKLTKWRKENITKRGVRAKIGEALLISVLTSAVSFLLPLVFGCQVR